MKILLQSQQKVSANPFKKLLESLLRSQQKVTGKPLAKSAQDKWKSSCSKRLLDVLQSQQTVNGKYSCRQNVTGIPLAAVSSFSISIRLMQMELC